MAAQLGMGCHIQLEDRVKAQPEEYQRNGNVLLDKLLGATLYSYPEGEDEAGADARLADIAEHLSVKGEKPFIVPLSADRPPLGALGYVDAACELMEQNVQFDEIFVATGSALTHCGLLFGLRTLGDETPVTGVCVRRKQQVQHNRVRQRLDDLAALMELPNPTTDQDIRISDTALGDGYGLMTAATQNAIFLTARLEGVFLDPVYTGKVMAGLIDDADRLRGKRVLFWHTGGQPALFGYANAFDQNDT
jgi:D-cysteine desulfhydrase/L-cysteate sulfo-lyase